MKTQPLRQDKHCLNCGTEVPERYCTHCGQENAVPHESFSHLVKHFIGDVLHYDSQFLTTLKYLLFRPGRLTKEYLAGKRVSYVNPIKLYIFVSFVFFLVLALVTHKSHDSDEDRKTEHRKDTVAAVSDVPQLVKDSLITGSDTIYHYRPIKKAGTKVLAAGPDTTKPSEERKKNKRDDDYSSVAAYDSAQQALPEGERAGAWERWFVRRAIRVGVDYEEEGAFEEAIKHQAPKMMFVLLPLFALWLKILYRKRYYADHAIFALHVHCFAYVMLLITLVLDYIVDTNKFTGWGIVLIGIYVWLALKNTYQQSFRRSFLKTLLLLIGYGISFTFVFVFFVIWLFAVIL